MVECQVGITITIVDSQPRPTARKTGDNMSICSQITSSLIILVRTQELTRVQTVQSTGIGVTCYSAINISLDGLLSSQSRCRVGRHCVFVEDRGNRDTSPQRKRSCKVAITRTIHIEVCGSTTTSHNVITTRRRTPTRVVEMQHTTARTSLGVITFHVEFGGLNLQAIVAVRGTAHLEVGSRPCSVE